MNINFSTFKLWRDFGVSALGLTIVLGIMAGGGFLLLHQGKDQVALAWVAALGMQAKVFYDGYIAYKKNGDGNSKTIP